MRKKTNILFLILILVCLIVFLGYRAWDAIRTDTQPPEISLSTVTPELPVGDSKDVLLQGISATDKQDGNVTDSLVIEDIHLLDSTGRLSVSYAAFDKSGNVTKAQQEAHFTDYVAPRFTLKTPLLYRSGTSFDILNNIGATDLFDGDLQHRIRATAMDSNSISTPGTHDVQFQLTNSLGDTAIIVLPVEVYDPLSYPASVTLNSYLVYMKVGDSFKPADYLDTFTLSGKTTSLNGRLPNNFSLQTIGDVQTSTPGVYTVQYLVTYNEKSLSNSFADRTYTGYSKLVIIVEG